MYKRQPLDIQVRNAQLLDLDTDVLVIGVVRVPRTSGGSGKVFPLPPSLKAVDDALGGALTKLVAKEDFTGKRDQSVSLGSLGRIKVDKIVVLGLGDRRSVGAPEIRTFAARAARCAGTEKGRSLALALPPGVEGELRAVAEGLELGAYHFTKYLTGDRKPKTEPVSYTHLGVVARNVLARSSCQGDFGLGARAQSERGERRQAASDGPRTHGAGKGSAYSGPLAVRERAARFRAPLSMQSRSRSTDSCVQCPA